MSPLNSDRFHPGLGVLRELAERLTGMFPPQKLQPASKQCRSVVEDGRAAHALPECWSLKRREEQLDDALRDTFPANEPVSIAPGPSHAPSLEPMIKTHSEDSDKQASAEVAACEPRTRRYTPTSPRGAESGDLAQETNDLMITYGIDRVPVDYFHYRGVRYAELDDAIAQARRDHVDRINSNGATSLPDAGNSASLR